MSFLESFDASRRIVAAKSGIFHSIHAQHHLVLDHKHVGQRGPSLELGKYMALRWYALRSWSMSSHMPRDQPQFFGMSLNARFCASLHPDDTFDRLLRSMAVAVVPRPRHRNDLVRRIRTTSIPGSQGWRPTVPGECAPDRTIPAEDYRRWTHRHRSRNRREDCALFTAIGSPEAALRRADQ
jgi:hypothetical protein